MENIGIKTKLLSEFENQLENIFKNYFENNLSFEECIHKVNVLKDVWASARFDLKNVGIESNSVEILETSDDLRIEYPDWSKNHEGQGCKIETDNNNVIFNVKSINDGNLNLFLRGIDYRDFYNNRIPVYVNYNKLVINDEIIHDEDGIFWHDVRFEYSFPCQNEETFRIEIGFLTIYHYFPLLQSYLEIINNIKDLNIYYEDIKKYLDFQKFSCQISENKNNLEDLNNFINSNEILKSEKNELLKSNDSFSNLFFVYNKYSDLLNNVNELNSKFELFEKRFDVFEQNTNKCIDSENFLFNTIFLDYELKPKRLLNNLQTLCTELLLFVDNICKKYDIPYWLDGGNLLGAIRHEYFIPWDDDMDIGMMRSDYHRFIDVMYDEIENHNLNDMIQVVYRYRNYNGKAVNSFIQFFVKDKINNRDDIMAGVDIFPFDYLKDYDPSTFGNQYNISKNNFYRRLYDGPDYNSVYMGLDYDEVVGKMYSEMNLSYEKQKYIVPGVEGSFGYNGSNMYELIIMETEKMFPLTKTQYGKYSLPVPNDSDNYLRKIYGDYLKVPKTIHTHFRTNLFREIPNINEIFEKYIGRLQEVNQNF